MKRDKNNTDAPKHVLYSDVADRVPWASYQLHKIGGCACAWNDGNVFPAIDFKGNR